MRKKSASLSWAELTLTNPAAFQSQETWMHSFPAEAQATLLDSTACSQVRFRLFHEIYTEPDLFELTENLWRKTSVA